MELKNIISAEQFQDRQLLEQLFAAARKLAKQAAEHQLPQFLAGKIFATLFYEASLRPRFSFEVAIQLLGGLLVSCENAKENSSAAKGEQIPDAIRVLNGYGLSGIVLRHSEVGAAALAAQYATIPVINAGDGAGEHPTQALLDFYTIKEEHGQIDGLVIALCGDLLFGRTIHSLIKLLLLIKPKRVYLVAPPALQLHLDYREILRRDGVDFSVVTSLEGVLEEVDVLYMTRIQEERITSPEMRAEITNGIRIGMPEVSRMKKDTIIMHPLPRNAEIASEVDSDPRARYFQQARHGLCMRMTLLQLLYASTD